MTSLDLTAANDAARPGEQQSMRLRALCVLFFFSGFPALIYQLTWQRELFLIFGVNIESVTIVVTAFMLGLGFGSLAGGWLSKQSGLPLLPALAAIEFLTAAFGLASLAIFRKVGEIAIGLSLPATAAASLALVVVPTLLMGATLPLLVGHLARRSRNIGGAVGLFYYVNTLGAAAACFACALLLFPFLGMSGAIYVAAAMNAAVALGALATHFLSGAEAESIVPAEMEALPSREGGLRPSTALLLAAGGGFVALSYEIFFFRTVSYATGSSAYAFALTLGAFLAGIASGAQSAGEQCRKAPDSIVKRLIDSLLLAGLCGALFLPVIGHLGWLTDHALLYVVMAMVYVIARLWGSLLPYLAEMSIMPDRQAGMRTAVLYLANILGSASGAVLTGFVAMNYLGLTSMAVTLVLAGVACTLLLIAAAPKINRLRYAGVAVAIGVVTAIVVPALSSHVLEDVFWKGSPLARHFAHVVQNRSGIITVTNDGTVFGNGMYDGQFNTDLRNDTNGIVRPYALSLFHPAPRDVLMIGLSSGSWAQVVANNPEVHSLTVVEINPGYIELIAREPEVASLLTNPKVRIITDDGRRWLRGHPGRRFDAVLSNTTFYFRASSTNLLSVEFLDVIRGHLNPGGIFFYNTTGSPRVQRTGCLAFAHGARFTNHLLVSDTPIAWDFRRWRRTLEVYRIDGKAIFDAAREADRGKLDTLMAWESDLAAGVGGKYVEPCPAVIARTADDRVMTDDNMGSEWLHFIGRD